MQLEVSLHWDLSTGITIFALPARRPRNIPSRCSIKKDIELNMMKKHGGASRALCELEASISDPPDVKIIKKVKH